MSRITLTLISLLCALMIASAPIARAGDVPTTATQMYAQSSTLTTQADDMLRGNPRTKTMYQAADLYKQAAFLLLQAAHQSPTLDPTADKYSAADLNTQAQKLYFQADQCRRNAVARETRGLP